MMFDSIRKLFAAQLVDVAGGSASAEHGYKLATAALLLEVTRADHEVSASEMAAVRSALSRAFKLGEAELSELMQLAEAEHDAAVCLYSFTRTINESLDDGHKSRIIELLWTVAYADGGLDSHEEHLIRKVADLLYVSHAQFIAAKLRAEERATMSD